MRLLLEKYWTPEDLGLIRVPSYYKSENQTGPTILLVKPGAALDVVNVAVHPSKAKCLDPQSRYFEPLAAEKFVLHPQPLVSVEFCHASAPHDFCCKPHQKAMEMHSHDGIDRMLPYRICHSETSYKVASWILPPKLL